jgi:hypothetical protein
MKLMKVLLITAAMTLVSAPNRADNTNGADEQAKPHPATAAEQAAPPATDKTDSSAMMAGMQDHMKQMQDTMAKIHATKSAEKRETLLKEHMNQMQEYMKMMKDMGAGSGMGNMAGKQDSGKGMGMGMMGEGMKCGMMDMMGMMQQMMGQMMDHMAMERSMGQ